MLLECTVLQQIRDEYYTADSLRTLFETIPETSIVEFLREAGFFYLIWKAIYPVQHIIRITHQLTKFGIYVNHHILTPLDSCNLFIEHKQLRKPLWNTANMSLRTCVVVKQMQSNQSTVYSGTDQRKHQNSASLAFFEGNSPVTDEFPVQRASNAENDSIWWCYHATVEHAALVVIVMITIALTLSQITTTVWYL